MLQERIKLVGRREMSLAVVGINHLNADGSNRRFEAMLCTRGEPVTFVPEPKNKFDRRALAVLSMRGVQLGYVTAERCGLIGAWIRDGAVYHAVFQELGPTAAVIRASFGGPITDMPAERPDVVYDLREMVYGEYIDWGC